MTRHSRVHWLDGARAFLILLGVLLHASRVYDTSGAWLVHDGVGSPAFEALWRVIHVFRMPAFFIVAGFFCALSVARHGAGGFLPRRFVRIGVPMVATALTLNLCQDWLLFAHEAEAAGLSAYLASDRFHAFWRAANWQSHLWFLHYLLAYSCLAWLWARLRQIAAPPARFDERTAPAWAWTALLPLTAFVAPAVASRLSGGYEVWFGLASPFSFLFYLPFFAFGYALHRRTAWLDSFARFGLADAAILAILVAMDAGLAQASGAWAEAARLFVQAAIAWSLCRALFTGFRAAIRRPSPALRYVSDAALSIYLFHHIFVVGLAIVFTHLFFDIGLEFAALVLLTLGASLAIHHYAILRVPALRFLFNGAAFSPRDREGDRVGPRGRQVVRVAA